MVPISFDSCHAIPNCAGGNLAVMFEIGADLSSVESMWTCCNLFPEPVTPPAKNDE